MNKYTKFLLGNGAFAAVAVCLYSPGLIGLSPFSPNAAAAAASVAIGAAAVPAFIWMNKSLLAEKEIKLLGVNEDQAVQKAKELMETYGMCRILGGIAKSAISQMERMENAQANFERLTARRFEAGTLSYQKFMAVMHSAQAALEKGYVRMANKMIIFDEAEYRRLTSDAYKKDDIPDQIQEEKRKLYDTNLEDLRGILESHERILLGIDHLMMEMSEVDCSDHEIDHAAQEIDTLLKQLEYYK